MVLRRLGLGDRKTARAAILQEDLSWCYVVWDGTPAHGFDR